MRLLFLINLLFITIVSNGQKNSAESVEAPKYDTTQIEIQSHNAFTFCSINFRILSSCKDPNANDCCRFMSQIFAYEGKIQHGQIVCDEAMSFYWTYFDSEEGARFNWENIMSQYEKQSKGFKKEKIKCFLYGKEIIAYKIIHDTSAQRKNFRIMGIGVINGQNFLFELSSMRELKCDADIKPTIRQLLKFG